MPLSVAEFVALPDESPFARPTALIVATVVFVETHVADPVTLPVEPSLKVAVAVNCWVAPAVMLGDAGETAIEVTVTVGAVTVSVAVAVNPSSVALMVVVPAVAPVASPPELTVATAVFDDAHVTPEVSAPVAPLLKVALAVNCWVAPAAMLAVVCETETAVTVGAGVVVGDPHPATTIKATSRVREVN
jgi:hypothetical protein